MTLTTEIDGLKDWIGRTETVDDQITLRSIQSFNATFDRTAIVRAESEAPLAIHWCLCPSIAALAEIGPDGHPAKGGFLPPVPLPRRMWAGGHLEIKAPIRIGDSIRRRSVIADVSVKQGRSGQLCFVTVDHEFSTKRGVAIKERQDIVYRGESPARNETHPMPSKGETAAKTRSISADPVLLFRYSALTFNGHRIHYDRDYCVLEEGYPGLVVQGPLQATMLLHLAADVVGQAPKSFSFRAMRPLFDGSDFTLNALRSGTGVELWTADGKGRRCMQATAGW